MSFDGIPPLALDFYEGPENENSKVFWTKAHTGTGVTDPSPAPGSVRT